MTVCHVKHEKPRDDSEILQECPEHRSSDHRQRGGLGVQVEEQTRPLVEARGAPAVREETVEEADDGRGLVELCQVLLAEYIRTEDLAPILDEQIGRGAAEERGVHGEAELSISLHQLLLFRSRHGAPLARSCPLPATDLQGCPKQKLETVRGARARVSSKQQFLEL